jgi:ribosome-binding protein aMBF1 (putative translation factor)
MSTAADIYGDFDDKEVKAIVDELRDKALRRLNMTTLEKFENACTAWLSEKDASIETFAGIIEASFEVFGTLQRDLSTEFEVAISTVSRWAKGTARPHPLLQKQIVRSLHRRASFKT